MGIQRDNLQSQFKPSDTLDLLVYRTCEKTQLTESTVRELFRDGWKYLEGSGQLKWVKGDR